MGSPTSLVEKIHDRSPGICLYGIAPPKSATSPERLAEINATYARQIGALAPDGLVVYDLQNEPGRSGEPRPFPFLPTIAPDEYAYGGLAGLSVPKVVYHAVASRSVGDLVQWCEAQPNSGAGRLAVLVGASSNKEDGTALRLDDAYGVVQRHAPGLVVGGIAIAERHGRKGDEHVRMLAKTERGVRFFVTQAVYDVTATKSLLSDYHYALQARGQVPQPIILTFSPCGSAKTLDLMRWLGISVPRWLENELLHDGDILARSVQLCEDICAEVVAFAREKGLPIGINVESISIRRAEIEAATTLFEKLRQLVTPSRNV